MVQIAIFSWHRPTLWAGTSLPWLDLYASCVVSSDCHCSQCYDFQEIAFQDGCRNYSKDLVLTWRSTVYGGSAFLVGSVIGTWQESKKHRNFLSMHRLQKKVLQICEKKNQALNTVPLISCHCFFWFSGLCSIVDSRLIFQKQQQKFCYSQELISFRESLNPEKAGYPYILW